MAHDKPHRPKLNDEARQKVEDLIDYEQEMGDSQLGTALELLLEWHDKGTVQ